MTYKVSSTSDQFSTNTEPEVLTEFGYINFLFSQDQVVVTSHIRSNAIAGTFLICGAFISMLTRLTNFSLDAYQGFTVDKALIKRLYSWKDNRDKPVQKQMDDEIDK